MTSDDDVRYSLDEPDRSLGDLVGDLTSDFSALVSDHINLAKVELKQDIKEMGKAGGLFGGAGVAGLIALIMLSMALGWALAEEMAPGWAFLIVGLAWTAVAAVLALTAKKTAENVDPVPNQTIEEIKEDKKWIKNQTS